MKVNTKTLFKVQYIIKSTINLNLKKITIEIYFFSSSYLYYHLIKNPFRIDFLDIGVILIVS